MAVESNRHKCFICPAEYPSDLSDGKNQYHQNCQRGILLSKRPFKPIDVSHVANKNRVSHLHSGESYKVPQNWKACHGYSQEPEEYFWAGGIPPPTSHNHHYGIARIQMPYTGELASSAQLKKSERKQRRRRRTPSSHHSRSKKHNRTIALGSRGSGRSLKIEEFPSLETFFKKEGLHENDTPPVLVLVAKEKGTSEEQVLNKISRLWLNHPALSSGNEIPSPNTERKKQLHSILKPSARAQWDQNQSDPEEPSEDDTLQEQSSNWLDDEDERKECEESTFQQPALSRLDRIEKVLAEMQVLLQHHITNGCRRGSTSDPKSMASKRGGGGKSREGRHRHVTFSTVSDVPPWTMSRAPSQRKVGTPCRRPFERSILDMTMKPPAPKPVTDSSSCGSDVDRRSSSDDKNQNKWERNMSETERRKFAVRPVISRHIRRKYGRRTAKFQSQK